ncbi:hypothetical protein [Psychrobacter sp. PAMC 21119]|uniref:hypothetical protein n=1 Tax=Psychrobacter sp. PAMC 21119 TaxID=1112209 RepID=UPI0002883891|nr:hypothetical protein [Psychrobacter sp. PAMC 21119]
MVESLFLSVCANYIYDYLKLALPITKDNLIAYFANKDCTLSEQNVQRIIDVIQEEQLDNQTKQLTQEDFIRNLENNNAMQQIVNDISNSIDNRVQINAHNSTVSTGTNHNFSDNSRQINTNGGAYNETNHYTQVSNEKKL